jgi:DNA-binding GntR family transcriptional regulator
MTTQPAKDDNGTARSTERVYEQIKLMAMTYRFRPGERINEIELSARLNVSRTPLREALNRLVSEGFVTTLPNRGFFGRLLDVKEIYDLYEARVALERDMVRLACERASDAALRELEAFARARPTHDDGKSLEALRHDEEFHIRIAQLSGNSEYVRILESITSRIHFVRLIDMRGRAKADSAAHLRLARLMRRRQTDAAMTENATAIMLRYEEVMEIIRKGIVDIYVGPDAAAASPMEATAPRRGRQTRTA